MDEYGKRLPLSGFFLKICAFLFMTIDHVGLFLMMYAGANGTLEMAGYVCRCIGRLAFPLFALLLAEGIRYSHNRWKYMGRIAIVFAFVTIVQAILIYGTSGVIGGLDGEADPLTDLLLCGIFLTCLTLPKAKKLYALIPLSVILLAYSLDVYEAYSVNISVLWFPKFLRPGYSVYGLLLATGFYYARPIAYALSKPMCDQLGIAKDVFPETYQGRRTENVIGSLFFFAATLAFWGISYLADGIFDPWSMSVQSYGLLAIILIYFYSGKRGYDSKWFRIASYSYFPVHLALIYAIFYLIFH